MNVRPRRTAAQRTSSPRVRRRGFTLLELAMSIATVILLVGITAEGMRAASRSTSAGAAREVVTTLMLRAGADAVAAGGDYTVNDVRRAAIGLQVSNLIFAFDCSVTEEFQTGSAFAPGCPAITLGDRDNSLSNTGAAQPGNVVAHIGGDPETLVVVAMAPNGQCITAVGRADALEDVTITDADAADSRCYIPSEQVPEPWVP